MFSDTYFKPNMQISRRRRGRGFAVELEERVARGGGGEDESAGVAGLDASGGGGSAEKEMGGPQCSVGDGVGGIKGGVEHAVGGVGVPGGIQSPGVMWGVGKDEEPSAADEPGLVVGGDGEDREAWLKDLGEDGGGVGPLADGALARGMQAVDDPGVGSDGGHDDEGLIVADAEIHRGGLSTA